jgi:hypothetical protein
MSNANYDYFIRRIVHRITNPVVAYANSPYAFFALYFQATAWAGIGGKREDRRDYSILDGPIKSL